MSNKSAFDLWQKQQEELANAPENWTEAGDIILPSRKLAHVFWNIINWRIAIEYEKKEDGGGKMLILHRAGKCITASTKGLARYEAYNFFDSGGYHDS